MLQICSSYGFSELINTLGETVPTSHHWLLGDEGKQAKLFGGMSGPPPYPKVLLMRGAVAKGGWTSAGNGAALALAPGHLSTLPLPLLPLESPILPHITYYLTPDS